MESACLIELYQTHAGVVFQCNRNNCYVLEFGGEQTRFRVSDFFSFKKKVDQIDLDAMIADPSPGADYVVLMPCRSQRCFLLSIEDVLDLRELLDGAKFAIELNAILRARLV